MILKISFLNKKKRKNYNLLLNFNYLKKLLNIHLES